MSSEVNPLDDLFRRKEAESVPDIRMMDDHWQEFQASLPPARERGTLLRLTISSAAAAALLIAGWGLWQWAGPQGTGSNAVSQTDHLPQSSPAAPGADSIGSGLVIKEDSAPATVRATATASVRARNSAPVTYTWAEPSIPATEPATGSHSAQVLFPADSQIQRRLTNAASLPAASTYYRGGTVDFRTGSVSNSFGNYSGNLIPANRASQDAAPPTIPDPRRQLNQFLAATRRQPQAFDIDARRDTTLACREGSNLFIPAGALRNASGSPVTGRASITVLECYSIADILSNRLSTMAGDRLLETGGMVEIRASADGLPLDLAPENTMRLTMPARRPNPDMRLFDAPGTKDAEAFTGSTAIGDTAQHGILSWKPVVRQQPILETGVTTGYMSDHKGKRNSGETERYEVAAKTSAPPPSADRKPRPADSARSDRQPQGFSYGIFDTTATNGEALLINGYHFELPAFGWFNCDRFLTYPPEQLTRLAVRDPAIKDFSLCYAAVVLQGLDVVVICDAEAGGFTAPRLPLSEGATLVCIGVKQGKVYTCIKDLKITTESVTGLHFSERTPDKFRQQLKRLGTVGSRR